MAKQIVRNRTKASRRSSSSRANAGEGKISGRSGRVISAKESRPHQHDRDLPLLRTSERGTFKRCHWKWWWEFEEKLKPKTDVPPLRFGNLIHQSLAVYYKPGTKRGRKPWLTFEELYEAECKEQQEFGFRVTEDEVWADAAELGPAMLKHYVEHYTSGVPDLPDDEFEVLVTEQPFRVLIYKPWTYDPNHPPEAQQGAEPWFWYVGILDGIWRHLPTKRIYIVDHKTAKAINPHYLVLDIQATAYWTWGLDWVYAQGLLKPREKPGGMLFNILRKAVPDARPVDNQGRKLNLDGSVSKKQHAPFFARIPIQRNFNEREYARQQVIAEFEDIERVRASRGEGIDGQPPDAAYKNQGQFTCPGCWLFDVCELHEMGADHDELLSHTVKTWDPYAQHEVEADERR